MGSKKKAKKSSSRSSAQDTDLSIRGMFVTFFSLCSLRLCIPDLVFVFGALEYCFLLIEKQFY